MKLSTAQTLRKCFCVIQTFRFLERCSYELCFRFESCCQPIQNVRPAASSMLIDVFIVYNIKYLWMKIFPLLNVCSSPFTSLRNVFRALWAWRIRRPLARLILLYSHRGYSYSSPIYRPIQLLWQLCANFSELLYVIPDKFTNFQLY